MKNTKILATLLATTIIITWISSTYAMYGQGNFMSGNYQTMQGKWLNYEENLANAPEEVQTIIEKRYNGEALTQDELDTLRSYNQEQRLVNTPEEIRSIVEKRYNHEALTQDELDTLRSYMPIQRWMKWNHNRGWKFGMFNR